METLNFLPLRVVKNSMLKIFALFGVASLISLSSCRDEENTVPELSVFPSSIISTPIVTSGFPTSVIEAQTPIDIMPSKTIPFHSNDPEMHYGTVKLTTVLNNGGENLRVNPDSTDTVNNYIIIGGKKYNLTNFHFHYSSEHTVDGAYSTMEIHFVNTAADNSYAVLGVLVDLGTGNAALQSLFEASPTSSGAINSPKTILNLALLFPANTREYYTYNGSLTTPNYGQNSALTNGGPVTWFVFKNKQQLSATQFNSYKLIYTDPNFRKTQPLNGRNVYANLGY